MLLPAHPNADLSRTIVGLDRSYFVTQSECANNAIALMKAFLRLAAVFSFVPCFIAGALILGNALASGYKDTWIVSAVGLVVIGLAFFLGSILLFAAERVSRNVERK